MILLFMKEHLFVYLYKGENETSLGFREVFICTIYWIITSTKNKKQFGDKLLFDNLSFDINKHKKIGLVGANGSGKRL